MKMKKKILLLFAFVAIAVAGFNYSSIDSIASSSLYGNPYVSFSPDGRAWTMKSNRNDIKWYKSGTIYFKDVESQVSKTGYHKCEVMRDSGILDIASWTVEHTSAQCIHNPNTSFGWHGLSGWTSACFNKYDSGWMAICADCGGHINVLVYGKKEKIQTLKTIDLSLDHYYNCPFCNHLEQGTNMYHMCKLESANKYTVQYVPNIEIIGGHIQKSTHIYDNKTKYEGKEYIASTKLTKNNFIAIGYEFTGWNTKRDGSGDSYTDEQQILNIAGKTLEDNTVILYGQWKINKSTLSINANGGSYKNSTAPVSITQEYNTKYEISIPEITPPKGYKISFSSDGGQAISPVVQTMHFARWSAQDMDGTITNNIYKYSGGNNTVDTIYAEYEYDNMPLPTCTKPGISFGGWYYDTAFTKLAGVAGDTINPKADVTLYAKWVNLVLYTTNNNVANGGKGAVDLKYSQDDAIQKIYSLYQSTDNVNWTKINEASDISNTTSINQTFNFNSSSHSFIAPYLGLYKIDAYGAQGGSKGSMLGGLGGQTKGAVLLEKGEILTIVAGGQNGYNGGGSGITGVGSSGGGSTIITSNKKGTVMVVGGGGAASILYAGGVGGNQINNTTSGLGGNGGAGGGAGYLGGKSGTAIYHTHVGWPGAVGGCYYSGGYCGSTSYSTSSYSNGCTSQCWYDPHYGNMHNGHVYTSTSRCNSCGSYYYQTGDEEIRRTAPCSYLPIYLGCGMTNSTVISAYPSYGGSNFIPSFFVTSNSYSGINSGNGKASIVSDQIGFQDKTYLDGVTALDKEKPNKPENIKLTTEESKSTQVIASWDISPDNGTLYYHKAESTNMNTFSLISTSNTTENVLTSGVAGYYYFVDTNKNTTVNKGHISNQSRNVTITLNSSNQYLHIASIDKADNISETTTIEIPSLLESGGGNEELNPIAYPLYTTPITIEESEGVFKSELENTYYVKTGDDSPFKLKFTSLIKNNATTKYQPLSNKYEIQPENQTEKSYVQIDTPSMAPITNSTLEYENSQLGKIFTGDSVLNDYMFLLTSRSDWGRKLSIEQQFTLNTSVDGVKTRVTPIARGGFVEEKESFSTYTEDMKNSIYLIGDSTAPIITGVDAMKDIKIVDKPELGSEDKTIININAEDSISGVKELYVVVTNLDNFTTRTFTSTDNKTLALDITKEDYLYLGDFLVEAYSVDNVGNISKESYSSSGFRLEVELKRAGDSTETEWRSGESGILVIKAEGYIEELEIIFPESWSKAEFKEDWPENTMNKIFTYDSPTYETIKEYQFMIPLYAPPGIYDIEVNAYKKGVKLTETKRLAAIGFESSVLESLKKRIK